MYELRTYHKPIGKKVERKLVEFTQSDDGIAQFEMSNHLGDVNLYIIRRENEVISMFKQNSYGKTYVFIFNYCEKTKQLTPSFPKSKNGKVMVFY